MDIKDVVSNLCSKAEQFSQMAWQPKWTFTGIHSELVSIQESFEFSFTEKKIWMCRAHPLKGAKTSRADYTATAVLESSVWALGSGSVTETGRKCSDMLLALSDSGDGKSWWRRQGNVCSGHGGHDDFQSTGGEAERTLSAQCVSSWSALSCFPSLQASSVTFPSPRASRLQFFPLSVSNPDLNLPFTWFSVQALLYSISHSKKFNTLYVKPSTYFQFTANMEELMAVLLEAVDERN